MGATAMRQTGTSNQLNLFHQHTAPATTTPKKERCLGVPIYKVSLVREREMPCYDTQIRSSATASEILHRYLEGADREFFVILLLDRKNGVIGISTISIGSLSASIVHPREVFKAAILSNAAAIIAAHNHPSGDPAPSQEDRVLTARLVEAGRLLGIQVLDHVILGRDRYMSFADEGLLSG
jgi:DNA repair protein RadC